MRSRPKQLVVSLLILAATGCTTTTANLFPPSPASDEVRTVYVINHGWHTGLVLRRDEMPNDMQFDLPATRYVEVGWGSGVFYMAPRITPIVAIEALCCSESVLHVAGFNGPPASVFPNSNVYAVRLSDRGFAELCRTIQETYVRDERGEPFRIAAGLYGEGGFYQANGRYYFPNTCNMWTARALRSAGCPIEPAISSTATAVMLQTGRFGELVSDR